MTLPDFLTRTPEGETRLSGHRIGLFHLVHYYNQGYSPEMLLGQYPTLPLALIHKAIAFYLENQAEVDAEVAAIRDELSRQREANPRRLRDRKNDLTSILTEDNRGTGCDPFGDPTQ